jgi:Putative Ig domain
MPDDLLRPTFSSGGSIIFMAGIRQTVWAVLLILFALAGCGGGSDGDTGSASSSGAGTNARPAILGQPSTVVLQGTEYAFQPAASGANGHQLTFSAANLPAWLTLNVATGRLFGIPAASDLGTYSGLTITVSDGSSTATMGPFSITVAASGDGSASLAWTPPLTNTDGSSLNDLTGFVVLYGTAPDQLSLSRAIDNPSVNRYVVENLTSGTWYFAVQAVNAVGVRSPLSGMASKTIG